MRVSRLTVENCRSYRDVETLDLDRRVSILVGPNGGGKSNTLDITTVVLRRCLLHSYETRDGIAEGVSWKDMSRQDLFQNTAQHLERHHDRQSEPTRVGLEIIVGATDVENLNTIQEHQEELNIALGAYRNRPRQDLEFVERWDPMPVTVGQSLNYSIVDGKLEASADEAHRVFIEYLDTLHMFMLLAEDLGGFAIRPTLVYFSPYRSATADDLRANLSGGETFLRLLSNYANATSRTSTSLIKLASAFFGEKKRELELGDGGTEAAWAADPDVKNVSEYLQGLGYKWKLRLLDANKNTYEVVLCGGGRDIPISQASSGEKEILNFLLGIPAMGTKGGMILIDEPELHLHPRWQAVLRELLRRLAVTTENQIVLSTHSPVFISPGTIGNVVRVAKDHAGTTRTKSVERGAAGDERSLVHIVNSHNNERILFADRVLLVEGIKDRVIMDAVIQALAGAAGSTEVVEVVEVHGKHNFKKYQSLMNALGVRFDVMADLDYAVSLRGDEFEGLLKTDWAKIDVSVLKDKDSRDRATLARLLEDALTGRDFRALEEHWQYVKGRYQYLRSDLDAAQSKRVSAVLDQLRKDGTHILEKGRIEDCLPAGQTSLDAVIELSRPLNLATWLQTAATDDRATDLLATARSVLGVKADELPDLCQSAANQLRTRADRDRQEEEASAGSS